MQELGRVDVTKPLIVWLVLRLLADGLAVGSLPLVWLGRAVEPKPELVPVRSVLGSCELSEEEPVLDAEEDFEALEDRGGSSWA